MVPSAFVVLDALPLTPNGKVDRAGLPAPERDRTAPEAAFVAAARPGRGPARGHLVATCSGSTGVGAFDNFFDLGGHSLLATQVASRIRDAFGVELPLREFFGDPTVAAVARRIEERIAGRRRPGGPSAASRSSTTARSRPRSRSNRSGSSINWRPARRPSTSPSPAASGGRSTGAPRAQLRRDHPAARDARGRRSTASTGSRSRSWRPGRAAADDDRPPGARRPGREAEARRLAVAGGPAAVRPGPRAPRRGSRSWCWATTTTRSS